MTSIVVVVVAFLAIVGGLVGVIVWSVRRGDRAHESTLAARDMLSAERDLVRQMTSDLERAKFELAAEKSAHENTRRRADALEDFIRVDAEETDPHADLDPGDVYGRVLRFSQRWSGGTEGTEGRDPVSADEGGAVHPSPSTGSP